MAWPLVVLWIALTLASSYLSMRMAGGAGEKPAPGELSAPVVDSSSPVPVLFGTRLMNYPNCVWYGDVGTTPIKSKGGKK